MISVKSILLLFFMATQCGALDPNPLAHSESPVEYNLSLKGFLVDLTFLRRYWLRITKDQNRPARILFCVCPTYCTPQIIVRFAPKIFEEPDWLDDFLEIRAPDNLDSKAFFLKDSTFYAHNGSVFTAVTDDTIRVQPFSTVPNHSLYIEIIYSTLKTFGEEIEDTLASLLRKTLARPMEALLKATYTYGTDKRNLYLEKVQLLKREAANDTVFVGTSQYLFIRFDREEKAFFTDIGESLNCTTLVRPIISAQNFDRRTWRDFLLFSERMHTFRDVLFGLYWAR